MKSILENISNSYSIVSIIFSNSQALNRNKVYVEGSEGVETAISNMPQIEWLGLKDVTINEMALE